MSDGAPTRSPLGSSRFKWRHHLPSKTSTLILIYFVVSLLMNGGLAPYKRGFFCNDTTIQYPFRDSTVSFPLLLVISLFIPWTVIKLLERRLIQVCSKGLTSRPRSRSTQYEDDVSPRSKAEAQELISEAENVKRRLVINEAGDRINVCDIEDQGDNRTTGIGGPSSSDEGVADENGVMFKMTSLRIKPGKALSDAQIFLFGFATTSFLTGIGKMACGRYRPHFMQRCKPDIDCTIQSNINRYIEDYECTNELLKPRDVSYITTSWPSGHAAIVFYSMLYMICYMNTVIPAIVRFKPLERVRSKSSPILVYSVYVLMFGLATYVSLTRVSDYHHHPTDVLSGIIIGVVVAYAFAVCIFRQINEAAPHPTNLYSIT